MADAEIRAAIRDAVLTGWAEAPPIGFENAPPPDGVSGGWIGLAAVVNRREVAGFGTADPVERGEGQVVCSLYVPLDEGQGLADAWVAALAGVLGQSRIGQAVRLGSAARRDVGRQGGWWRVEVSFALVVDPA